ncbi:MAG: hybrid sensor histidine kinase/response regulator [Ignavibacteriaceae bacterium]
MQKNFFELFDELEDVFLWYSSGEKNGDSVFYSAGIEKVTGYTAGEVKLFPELINKIIAEEDLQKVKKQFNDFVRDPSRSSLKLIYRVVCKDKKIIWVKENVSAKRDGDGKVKLFKGVVTNISELKSEQQSLKKSLENFQQLNESKDKFISMLSHDLRAPFTSILGFAEILINEPNLSDSERLEYLTYINDSSQNQLQLINYLLDWSRLQTGRLKIEPLRLHAQTIVYNCISSLTGNAIRKNIEIKVNVKDSLYIQADERLLMQVITNLLSNAIKFSREHETIQISTDVFNNGMAEFIVKDDGVGIPEDNKSKIFKIEKIFSTEGTKGEKGTGLGLSLVKEIIEKHNGAVWFYSKLGEGSEFHFTIPCSQNVILIVEDNPLERMKYEDLIQQSCTSYKTITVENGYEAMEVIFENFPSLVITGHDMPLMNGLQLVESIRKEDIHFRIPIFSVVPKISEEVIASYKKFGVDEIFQKPVDLQMLSDKLQKILG